MVTWNTKRQKIFVKWWHKKKNFKVTHLFRRINPYYGLFLVCQTLSYFLIGFAVDKFSLSLWSPKTFLDIHIPFLPFMVIPYMLYLIVMAAPLFLNLKNREIQSLLISLVSASFVTYLISFSYSVSPSPRYLFSGEEKGVFIFIVKTLYKHDTSPLYFPSLHSLHSLLIGLHLWKKGSRRRVLLPCAFLISLSTVFVKQHFFTDTVASLFLVPVIYYFNRFVLSLKAGKKIKDNYIN